MANKADIGGYVTISDMWARASAFVPQQLALSEIPLEPGLIGPWRVSGQSGHAPADGIRLDVNHVENWTLFGDLTILAQTVGPVINAGGAF